MRTSTSFIFICLIAINFAPMARADFLDRYIENEEKKEQTLKVDKILKQEFLTRDNPCLTKRTPSEASNCFENMFNNPSLGDEALQDISQKLKLKEKKLIASEEREAISEFLANRLKVMFDPSYNPKSGASYDADKSQLFDKYNVSQKTMIELYKNQVGKNSIQEIMTFCRYNQFNSIDQKWEKASTNNTEDINKNTDLASSIDPEKTKSCLEKIKTSCLNINGDKIKRSACLLKKKMKRYGNLLDRTQRTLDKMSEADENAKASFGDGFGIKTYEGEGKQNFDAITSLSSGDFNQLGKKIKKSQKKMASAIEQCKKGDQKSCDKLIANNTDHLEKELQKYLIETGLNLKRIGTIKKFSKEEKDKEKFISLYSAYMTKDQIKSFTKKGNRLSPDELEGIQQRIKNKYAQERKLLMLEMNAKIEKAKTQSTNDQEFLTELEIKMKERVNKLKNDQLFSNINAAETRVQYCPQGYKTEKECKAGKLGTTTKKYELYGLKKYAPKFYEEEMKREDSNRGLANSKNKKTTSFTKDFIDGLIGD